MHSHRGLFPVVDRYVYLNHAGLSPVPTPVVDRMRASITVQAEHGLVRIEDQERGVEAVRSAAAVLVGCGSDEITFVRNTSHGLSLVAAGLDWRAGDNVLCATTEEYPSNVYPWLRLATRGVELRTVGAPGGRIDVGAYAEAGDARTRLVVVSSVQYASGVRVDLTRLGQLCADRGWLLCVDGIQSLGAIPSRAKADGVHFLSADAHKWMLGPPGIGVLFVDRAVALDPVLVGWRSTKEALNFDQVKLDLREDAARFEEGSLSYPSIEGMGAAIELLLDVGVDAVWARIRELNDHLTERLVAGGHRVLSPTDEAGRSGSVVFRPRDEDPALLVARLQEHGVIVSCRRGGVRVSPHFYNTPDDLDRLLALL